MLDICDDINEAKECFGQMAYEYSIAATYGRATDEMLYNLASFAALIDTLQNSAPYKKYVQLTSSNLQGKFVSLSSLQKQNNTLILNISEQKICSKIEVRPCLSDEEICKVVEQVKVLCHYCQ